MMEARKAIPCPHIAVAVLVTLLCSERAPAAQNEPANRPALPVPVIDAKPVVDGKLDEACWKNAATTGILRVTRGNPSKATTTAFIVRDADHLYVGVRCTGESKPAGECVELAIDSNADGNSYYLIQFVPANGRVTTTYNEHDPHWFDKTWRPSFPSAVSREAGAWSAEFALPFDIFNKNKTLTSKLGFNVVRSGLPGHEHHCWHGTPGVPGDWGLLTGIMPRHEFPRPEYSRSGLDRFYRTPNPAQTAFLAEEARRTIPLGSGSAHPGTTGEVRLELMEFLLAGDPHSRGIIWDLAVDEDKGELYVLADTRKVRGVSELRVFDRQGRYLRTIMPVNPTLPRPSVQDICYTGAREGGVDLIVPKQFHSYGEPAMYGQWWHHPQKLALTPDGDLIMANLYRGVLWHLKPDGRFPADGWTSAYNSKRNDPFESTDWTQHSWFCHDLKNHLPFRALHYPYFCFSPDGALYISAGQSARPTKRYTYHYEVGENNVTYQWPIAGSRGGAVWKCRLKPGPKAERKGVFSGFAEPSGLVVDGDNLIVADAGHDRLQVLDREGNRVTSITHYEHEGQKKPLYGPTALAMGSDKSLYVLIGSESRRQESARNHGLQVHRPPAGKAPAELPRRVIKLRSWQQPEWLAASGPLHPHVLQIAVDTGVEPALIWVANAAGPGSLQQLSGDDLSLKATWRDRGETLSHPRQSGDQPILNIDPNTGHLYVEDDSNYRLKQYGTVYRLDQQGNVLKTWDPLFFDAVSHGVLSPWGTLDPKRHFRHPEEPLFIDSIFGKDGRVYRWKLDADGIRVLRFDRAGQPVPFASTGTHALFVEPAMKFTFWHDVCHGMDVDEQGNIYYVAKADRKGVGDAYHALHRQVNVHDAGGNLKKKGLLVLDSVRGIQVDNEGNLYALHRPVERPWADYLALSKFASSGGRPLWTRRWDGNPGVAQLSNPPCHCTTTRFHQTLDGKGYLYAAGKYSVQVIRCETGELVGEFGSYGNMDCRGKGSRFPHPELPFGTISSLSVWKDRLFVVDELNRRIVKCRIVYEPAKRN